MRIAILTPLFFPFDGQVYKYYGGMEPFCEGLANYWADMGHEVRFFCGYGSTQWRDDIMVYPADHPPSYRDTYLDDERPLFLKYEKEILECDVIFDQTHFLPSYREKILKGFDTPIASTWHHSPFNIRSLPPVDHQFIVSISKWQRDRIQERFDIRLPVIYSGIRQEIFPERAYEKEEDLYLFLARCSSSKAPHLILKLADRYPDCRFVILGELIFTNEPYYDFMLQKEASKRDNVKFWCNLDDNYERKIEYLQRASGLIHPSIIDEPFSINFIEAFRYDTPVYTWNRGAFPEIVDRSTGMLIPRQGYTPTQEEIDVFIERFEEFRHKKFKHNSFKQKLKKFDLKNTAKNYLKLFKSAINGRHSL